MSDDLAIYLRPKGKIPGIGKEKGRRIANGVSRYTSEHGSVRYVLYEKRRAIAALQVVSSDGQSATAANIYVVPSHRRRGLATDLLTIARGDFAEVRGAQHLSEDGRAWSEAVGLHGVDGIGAMSTVEQELFDLDVAEFTEAFFETLLWSENDDDGTPLDANYAVVDIDETGREALAIECRQFVTDMLPTIESAEAKGVAYRGSLFSQAGHDFVLTRNGHGAGFRDGDWPKPEATELTDYSKKYPEVRLYVGDDGGLYAFPYETGKPKGPAAGVLRTRAAATEEPGIEMDLDGVATQSEEDTMSVYALGEFYFDVAPVRGAGSQGQHVQYAVVLRNREGMHVDATRVWAESRGAAVCEALGREWGRFFRAYDRNDFCADPQHHLIQEYPAFVHAATEPADEPGLSLDLDGVDAASNDVDYDGVPVINPLEVNTDDRLFKMWAGQVGTTRGYVWADGEEAAFEEWVEYLDDHAPGMLTTVGEDELREAAADLGVSWKSSWPDWDDPDFEPVAERAEADLTVIGHTTLKHGTHIPSDEWGMDEVTGTEYDAVRKLSAQAYADQYDEWPGNVPTEEGIELDLDGVGAAAQRRLSLWKFNRITGYWNHQRVVEKETADRWLLVYQRDEPEEFFKLSRNQPSAPPPSKRRGTGATPGHDPHDLMFREPDVFEDHGDLGAFAIWYGPDGPQGDDATFVETTGVGSDFTVIEYHNPAGEIDEPEDNYLTQTVVLDANQLARFAAHAGLLNLSSVELLRYAARVGTREMFERGGDEGWASELPQPPAPRGGEGIALELD